MGTNTYRDWIPEGEDTGAQGDVFKDFVEVPKPQKKEEITVAGPTVQTEFKCEVCGKVVSSKLALAGHSRSHK